MEERRKFVRLDTRLQMQCTVLPTGTTKATVSKDIGGGGICLFSDKPLTAGTRVQVAMKLPDKEQPVNFVGEVVWCDQYEVIGKAERQHSIEAGVRFVEISPQDRDAVMQYVILQMKSPGP